jgi:hypothetical protein
MSCNTLWKNTSGIMDCCSRSSTAGAGMRAGLLPDSVIAKEVSLCRKIRHSSKQPHRVLSALLRRKRGMCVLCDATNETSVRDMLCRDNKEACKHCKQRSTVLGTRGNPRRKQSQANLLTVVNLLHDIIWSSSRTPNFPGHPFGCDLSYFIHNSAG